MSPSVDAGRAARPPRGDRRRPSGARGNHHAAVCELSITRSDGTTTVFDAVSGDGNSCGTAHRLVSFDSLSPFLATLHCAYAKDQTAAGAAAPPLAPDDRCWNGLFVGVGIGGGANGLAALNVPLSFPDAATEYHVELDDCASPNRVGKLHMQLVAPGGGALAAGDNVGDPGPDQACQRLTVKVPQPGTYSLSVTVDDGFLPVTRQGDGATSRQDHGAR